jgi:hypothetical protein
VIDEFFPLVPGETARRIGRLDEAPCVHQGKRRRGSGVREPVSVRPLSVISVNGFFARVSGSGSERGVADEVVVLAPVLPFAYSVTYIHSETRI